MTAILLCNPGLKLTQRLQRERITSENLVSFRRRREKERLIVIYWTLRARASYSRYSGNEQEGRRRP